MRLISSNRTKRRISLMFVFALMLSNLLALVGPEAKAAVSVSSATAGTCYQHTGTAATDGSLVTIYDVGTIQITLTASEVNPGQDASGLGTATTGVARATNGGSISTAGDVIGNVVTLEPPTGTNFVVLPGFQDTTTGASNLLAGSNASISNAVSQEQSTGSGTPDGSLGISVGVVTAGTAGIGSAVIAIARDADSTGAASTEQYPKTNTGTNNVAITIMGLGIAIPPTGDESLSGTINATLKSSAPTGIGTSGDPSMTAVSSAIPTLSNTTVPLCTITSPLGQLEAILDTDNDSAELYDKTGTASANIVALGQIGSETKVWAFDTTSMADGAGGSDGTSLVDIEPIIIRGKGTLSGSTNDQLFRTGRLNSDVTSASLVPNGSPIDTAMFIGLADSNGIVINFTDDNASATSTLKAVDIIIENSSASSGTPATAGFSATHTSRHGFLGSLRAALFDSANNTTNNVFNTGASWGVASVGSNNAQVAVQEGKSAAGTNNLGGLGAITANAVEPFNNTFVDLRLECGSSTNPVGGWFVLLNSTALNVGTTTNGHLQTIESTRSGNKFSLTGVQSGRTTLYTQGLTNIAGSNPVHGEAFSLATFSAANNNSFTAGNALLYASCTMNALTIIPINNGFDAQRDVIAVTPLVEVTNISNTFTSDVNLQAVISGNNLSGETTLNLATLVGVPATGSTSSLVSAQGVGLAANSSVGVDCSSGSTASVVLTTLSTTTTSAATAASAACTSGSIAAPPPFFVGGAPATVSGTTVIDASPTIQGEGRGVLLTESSNNGFNQLIQQVGGGATGTLFEIQLPSGCDFIDDQNDPITAATTTNPAAIGNDVSRLALETSPGADPTFLGGAGDAALTSANVLETAAGSTPAKAHFRLTGTTLGGTNDQGIKDSILVKFDAQDIFCPAGTTGALSGMVFAQNKVSNPTIQINLGTVSFGTATDTFTFGFADDSTSSTKGEMSTNSMIGATPRLVGSSSTCTSNPFVITEKNSRSFPIGGRVSSRNADPDNSVLSSVITKGQIWIIPAAGSAFSTAPATTDISFSDTSIELDGAPAIATTASINSNAPLGSLVIPIKKGTATGAPLPEASTTSVTVRNLKLAAATSSTTDLVASVEFFSQDAGAVFNTAGVVAGNSASTPTLFTPYAPGSTKASTQLNVAAAAAVQLGSGSLANQLVTSRLTAGGAAQVNPFASQVTAVKAADSSKISASGVLVASTTDNKITVTGAAGSVDAGADVTVATSDSFDSVTVKSSTDGSFTAVIRGDCSTGKTSATVNVTPKICGTSGTAATKTVLCSADTGGSAEEVKSTIAGADGVASVQEVLDFITAQGGLDSVIAAGGNTLNGVILAIKEALGLT